LGPRYQVDSISDYYPENETVRKPHEPPMVGPIYPNIDVVNQYNPAVEERVKGILDIAAPVYPVETKNVYGPVPKREGEGELMVGPVYHGIVTKNEFVPPKEKGYGEIANVGPVRKHVDDTLKYTPIIETFEHELARCGPVYHGIDAGKSNKYVPAPANKETEKTFKAPIYTGIEVKSKYFPQAEEKPKVDAGLLGPRYQVDSISDYYPENETVRKPHEPPMVGPIYPNIDVVNQYNPAVEERVKGILDIAAPVYPVETKNVYGPVPKREGEGELMVGPVYHGILTKNEFVPPKEKGYGEIANVGPVRKHVDDTIKYTPIIEKFEHELARCGPVYHGIDAGKSNKYCPKSERVPGELAPAYPVLNEQTMPKGMFCPTGIETSKRVDNALPLEGPLYFNKHNKELKSDL